MGASCSASLSSSSSSSAKPSASRWATGPPGHGAPSTSWLSCPSDLLSFAGLGAAASPSDSPSSESPESGVSRMGERGGKAGKRAPRDGNVHSKDWERLQPDSLPREGSARRSPGWGRALSEPPSSPRPCPEGGGRSTPSEQRRSPTSREGRLKSGPSRDRGDTAESSGPSGEPGGREALARGGLGGSW